MIAQRLKQQGLELPAQSVLRQQVLERLVLQEIQMQRAKRAGIRVSDEQLNAALADVAQRNGMPLRNCRRRSPQQGVDYASYRDGMRKELTLSVLRQRDVIQKINVSAARARTVSRASRRAGRRSSTSTTSRTS